MLTLFNQRWRSRRDTYRPAGEPIETRHYEVAAIEGDRVPKQFILEHHYSGSYPAARFRYGLYCHGELVGVAVFGVPINYQSLRGLPGERASSLELSRFVLLDEVPANGESWFLARAFALLRRAGLRGVIAFSDPCPRLDGQGVQVFPGHIGTIYQASNAVYLGRSRAEARLLLPDGSLLHGRALAKIRGRRRGWRYAAARLEHFGAPPLRPEDDAELWVATWARRLARRIPHPGNHKYCWALVPRDRRWVPPGREYPKVVRPS